VDNEALVTLTADIAAAFVSNNRVPTTGIGELISSVHTALSALDGAASKEAAVKLEPAVPVRSSIKPDYIVCLEDGKKLKMLKRHLMTHYQLTPAQYREKWNLKADYPMVAPNYAETRKALALKSGLGRKPVPAPAPVAAPAAPKGRPKTAKRIAAEVPAVAAAAPAPKPKRKILKATLVETPPAAAPAAKRGRRKASASA
jgi:predicted transcriptional regulator